MLEHVLEHACIRTCQRQKYFWQKKVNLKTLTILTKILTFDDWLGPGCAFADC